MALKRVILARGSALLREMLHRVLDTVDQLEVVQEISDWEELPAALERFGPDWVIVQESERIASHPKLNFCMERYPSARFVFFSPEQNMIKIRWQVFEEAEYPDLSLREFIRLLEKDLQGT